MNLRTLRKREALDGYLFASPWILGFLIFTLGPVVFSFFLSLTKWDAQTPLSEIDFVGFVNYKVIFKNDPLFWKSLGNTAYFVFLAVPLSVTIALLLAVLLNQRVKGVTFFRTVFYLPSVVSGVATAVLWIWIFNPTFGVLNTLLGWLGIQGPNWLLSEAWSKPALIIMQLWALGGAMLVYLAGLQGIPIQLYEAADLDGASTTQKFWHVTIPVLTPTIFFNLVMSIIGSFQVFTSAYVVSDGMGSPNNSTLMYVLYLFRKAFIEFRMGYASALAWILFVIILIFTLMVFKSSAAWVYYEAERK
jgi:multiple sugar transport system permease protein